MVGVAFHIHEWSTKWFGEQTLIQNRSKWVKMIQIQNNTIIYIHISYTIIIQSILIYIIYI